MWPNSHWMRCEEGSHRSLTRQNAVISDRDSHHSPPAFAYHEDFGCVVSMFGCNRILLNDMCFVCVCACRSVRFGRTTQLNAWICRVVHAHLHYTCSCMRESEARITLNSMGGGGGWWVLAWVGWWTCAAWRALSGAMCDVSSACVFAWPKYMAICFHIRTTHTCECVRNKLGLTSIRHTHTYAHNRQTDNKFTITHTLFDMRACAMGRAVERRGWGALSGAAGVGWGIHVSGCLFKVPNYSTNTNTHTQKLHCWHTHSFRSESCRRLRHVPFDDDGDVDDGGTDGDDDDVICMRIQDQQLVHTDALTLVHMLATRHAKSTLVI